MTIFEKGALILFFGRLSLRILIPLLCRMVFFTFPFFSSQPLVIVPHHSEIYEIHEEFPVVQTVFPEVFRATGRSARKCQQKVLRQHFSASCKTCVHISQAHYVGTVPIQPYAVDFRIRYGFVEENSRIDELLHIPEVYPAELQMQHRIILPVAYHRKVEMVRHNVPVSGPDGFFS